MAMLLKMYFNGVQIIQVTCACMARDRKRNKECKNNANKAFFLMYTQYAYLYAIIVLIL